MKLYGSQTSPYVRRIRLFVADSPCDFIKLNILEGADRETLAAMNPTMRIPMLEDDGHIIFDSGVIYRYLAAKVKAGSLSWYQENQLTVINAVNDSLVMLYQCSRSGLDTNEDKLFYNLQRERIAASMFVLEQQAANAEFANWSYPAMALYSLLDWIAFRELIELDDYPALLAFLDQHKQHPMIKQSDPRLT
ncbi:MULTISPECIES: glutathione S-transferase family protein [unclassified Arsukibacterium]|uniref:glutathione S-transferase family protein n=1 Tax=unclassified Arsukibacterium TaxID=2635278 RepID=UPI000C3A1D68|nr:MULTISPECIES: glutathione S-transferase family protein [unclassified Arsukibacterium]MAA96576.1 glutathione S-transferase [Rheinheimera sp.]MBM33250.1 glutathione S-transferase [Rheinheimera sp.]HAW91733.1 glutathione S-transferase [Candidatus Azambacteria bacterium]|tara:strand:+ start:156 stop:731 length:576 start_codon:yes stop_codon:yes gene_type:complete